MRVAPVGLLYWWNRDLLLDAAVRSSIPTHAHPFGVEGARIMALAVGLTLSGMEKKDIPAFLLDHVREEIFRQRLLALGDLCTRDPDVDEVARLLGSGVRAQNSVPAALYAFTRYGHDFEQVMAFCLDLGGDTDTIAAMAGALSGAMVGEGNLPRMCLQRLESSGRIRDLSFRLWELSDSLRNSTS
jgi:poly(ADP-ribose) glycohydrolase ARH3